MQGCHANALALFFFGAKIKIKQIIEVQSQHWQ
jgi:hypothetical protein